MRTAGINPPLAVFRLTPPFRPPPPASRRWLQPEHRCVPRSRAAAQFALLLGRLPGRRRASSLPRRLAGTLAAEADLAFADIDAEDLDLDGVADLDDVFGLSTLWSASSLMCSTLRDPFQFDEHAEIGELRDLPVFVSFGL